MLGKTHIVFGLLCAVYLFPTVTNILNKLNLGQETATAITLTQTIIFYIIIIVTSLLPDIDSKNSIISKKLWPIAKIIQLVAKHRGFFHSIYVYAYLSAIGFLINPLYATAIIIGFGSHLIGDSLTKEGINFLHPFSQFKVAGPITTGSFTESILFYIFLALIIIKIF